MEPRVRRLLREANQRFRQGDKTGAAHLLRQVIALDPTQALAWYGLAQCVDDPRQKRTYLEQALALNPNLARARTKLEQLQQRARGQAPAFRQVRAGASRQRLRLEWVLGALAVVLALFVCGLSWDLYRNAARQRAAATATAQRAALATAAARQQRAATATAAAYQAATATATCRDQFYDDMLYLLSRFFRQQSIAENTPRITLAPQIARLEDIRDEAWSMPTKKCNPRVHARLMDYMDKTIAAYTEFLGVNDDESVALLLVVSLKALADLDDEVVRDGHPGGLLPMFRAKGYFYWEILEEPRWKEKLRDQ